MISPYLCVNSHYGHIWQLWLLDVVGATALPSHVPPRPQWCRCWALLASVGSSYQWKHHGKILAKWWGFEYHQYINIIMKDHHSCWFYMPPNGDLLNLWVQVRRYSWSWYAPEVGIYNPYNYMVMFLNITPTAPARDFHGYGSNFSTLMNRRSNPSPLKSSSSSWDRRSICVGSIRDLEGPKDQ